VLLIKRFRQWVAETLALPLKSNKIRSRHQVVSYLKENQEVLQKMQNQIKQISDLERLISKYSRESIASKWFI
jgi:DNA mismatch repair protein MutS